MNTVRDKVFIITGAGGAIASEVAGTFAKAGARLMLVDREGSRVQGLGSTFNALTLEADVSTREGAETMVAQARQRFSRVDGLLHLVGDVVTGPISDVSEADYDLTFDTNVRSLIYATQAVLPELRKRPEAFLCGLGSREAWAGGGAKAALFAAAKSAAAAFLYALDAELADTGIEISVIFPMGLVDTAANRRRFTPEQLPIQPTAIASAILAAAQTGPGGRLLEVPIYPPRR